MAGTLIFLTALGFAVVLLFFVLTGSLALLRSQFGTWGKAYQRVAKRYGALVTYGLGKPKLSFNYGANACTLKNARCTASGGQDRRQTQLTIAWRQPGLRLWVASPDRMASGRTLKKMKLVVLESPAGQPPLQVYSDCVEMARQWLTPASRWVIQQLSGLHGDTGVEILVQRGCVRISKPGYIRQFRPLDDFLRLGLELFDQFKLARNHDIEFIGDDAAVVVEEVKCPICSEVIKDDMVVCLRCKTPHCADCWEYNGQCATFACHETRYLSTPRRSNSFSEP